MFLSTEKVWFFDKITWVSSSAAAEVIYHSRVRLRFIGSVIELPVSYSSC